jgi:hypothetical protein
LAIADIIHTFPIHGTDGDDTLYGYDTPKAA